MKTCHLCIQEIENKSYAYVDIVWSRSRFGRSLGSVLKNNRYRIRYFFHRRCKRLFLAENKN